jgi:hypothetical protein
MSSVATLRAQLESSLDERLSSTLLLRERTAPPMVPTGIAALDALTGGLPRGALSEITGPASSGRTGVVLSALAAATGRQEVCALVDACDSFDPASADAAGVDLERLLWVRCNQRGEAIRRPGGIPATMPRGGRLQASWNAGFAYGGKLEQVLKVTDLLLQGGGFGMVVLDLGDVPVASARRVPLTSWFRFRRAVEPTATVLLLVENESCARTCASLVVRLQPEAVCASAALCGSEEIPSQQWLSFRAEESFHAASPAEPARVVSIFSGRTTDAAGEEDRPSQVSTGNLVSHGRLLRGMRFRAEVVRSWAQRKPPHSAGAQFELRTTMG